jgi:hypothetical protein
MDIQLFSDMIDALGKVVGGVKVLTNLPKNERDQYRQLLDDTDQLILTTLNMIILRMGDVLLNTDEAAFLTEVRQLDNFEDWLKAERGFRLCQSLRVAVRETEGLIPRLAGKMSTKDWAALLDQMHRILSTEGQLADFVGREFNNLASAARRAQPASPESAAIRQEVESTRDTLKRQREKLLRQEVEILDLI